MLRKGVRAGYVSGNPIVIEDTVHHAGEVFAIVAVITQTLFIEIIGQFFVDDFLAIDCQAFISINYFIAGDADDALDIVERGVFGEFEHHHIAARGIVDGNDFFYSQPANVSRR